MTEPQFVCDVLIIGSGAAGLSLAVRLARSCKVAVIAKKELTEGCTQYAQGGIAAVLNDTDSVESHVEDTLRAGAGLCDSQVVRHTVEHSREQIQWLINMQVPKIKRLHCRKQFKSRIPRQHLAEIGNFNLVNRENRKRTHGTSDSARGQEVAQGG